MTTVANEISLEWIDGLRFEGWAGTAKVDIDGDGERGTSPVNLLLESVGACAAADVVDILEKGRQKLTGMTVRVTADRREETPRYVKRLYMTFRIEGDVDSSKAQRAVDLSLEKYCSVFHSLRMDLNVETEIELD